MEGPLFNSAGAYGGGGLRQADAGSRESDGFLNFGISFNNNGYWYSNK